jgi:hypothetical protein
MRDWISQLIIALVFVGVPIFGVHSCVNSDWHQKELAAAKEQEARERIPRLYSEAGDCAVYTFKAGDRWQYFTRCKGAATSTTTTWNECSTVGKQTQCTPRSSTVEGKP